MKNPEYATLPARLRMNVLANPGVVDKVDFELWCNGRVGRQRLRRLPGRARGRELRKHGVPAAQVQAALRIGAVVHAASRIAASEAALAG
jgi:alkyl hydroperoxide reductase subunit D